MQYFVPDLRLPADVDDRSLPGEKLGGRPEGLPRNAWPKCKECGKSQSLLAQFRHHPMRLDLGREGRVLFVFQCAHRPGLCSTWEGGSGANACFVIEPEELTQNTSEQPSDTPPEDNEVCIVRWHARDDRLPAGLIQSFFDDEKHDALSDRIRDAVTWNTRLGGFPSWIQNPSEAPSLAEGWKFVGQLDSTYSFLVAPSTVPQWVSIDSRRWEGRSHIGEGPAFGDAGIAYLFLRATQSVPEGWFFWQCG